MFEWDSYDSDSECKKPRSNSGLKPIEARHNKESSSELKLEKSMKVNHWKIDKEIFEREACIRKL